MNEVKNVISDEEAIKRFEESWPGPKSWPGTDKVDFTEVFLKEAGVSFNDYLYYITLTDGPEELDEQLAAGINAFLIRTAEHINNILSVRRTDKPELPDKELFEEILSNEKRVILLLKSAGEKCNGLEEVIDIISLCSEKIQSKFIEHVLSDNEFFIKIKSNYPNGGTFTEANFEAFVIILKKFPDSRSEIIEKVLSNQHVVEDFFRMDDIECDLGNAMNFITKFNSPQFTLNFIESILNSSALHKLVQKSRFYDAFIEYYNKLQKIMAEEIIFSDKIERHGMFANTFEARLAARERAPNSLCPTGLPSIKIPNPVELPSQEEIAASSDSSNYDENGFRL